MPNPTITVTLDSLNSGTAPAVTNSVDVQEGGQLDVNVTWPGAGADTITCDLNFQKSGNQDPFSDVIGGDTSFNLTRTPPSQSAVHTLAVKQDATIGNDTYVLTLTINGTSYSTDPIIDVNDDPP